MLNRPSHLGWDPTTHYQSAEIASTYDSVRFSSVAGRIYQWLERRALLRAFGGLVPVPEVILDLPCGTGRLAEPLLDAGYKVIGADISVAMLQEAEQRLARFSSRFVTCQCNAREAGKQADKFDAALCARVLMHFPLDEQIKFLGGVVGAVHHNVVLVHSLDTRYQRFRRLLKRCLGHQASVAYPVTERELNQLLSKSGLREIRRLRLWRLVSEAVIIVAEKTIDAATE